MVDKITANKRKIHYSMYGEWGSTRVNCGRYFTTDVNHTDDRLKVTCKMCLIVKEG